MPVLGITSISARRASEPPPTSSAVAQSSTRREFSNPEVREVMVLSLGSILTVANRVILPSVVPAAGTSISATGAASTLSSRNVIILTGSPVLRWAYEA